MLPIINSAIAWTDGGAEFVFNDGTVLILSGPSLDTYVKLSPSLSSASLATLPSHHIDTSPSSSSIDKVAGYTAMVLSRDRPWLAAAVELYNQLTPRPKLVTSLLLTQQQQQQRLLPRLSQSSSLTHAHGYGNSNSNTELSEQHAILWWMPSTSTHNPDQSSFSTSFISASASYGNSYSGGSSSRSSFPNAVSCREDSLSVVVSGARNTTNITATDIGGKNEEEEVEVQVATPENIVLFHSSRAGGNDDVFGAGGQEQSVSLVTVRLHRDRQRISVTWPARVYDCDGLGYSFVSFPSPSSVPSSSSFQHSSSLSSNKTDMLIACDESAFYYTEPEPGEGDYDHDQEKETESRRKSDKMSTEENENEQEQRQRRTRKRLPLPPTIKATPFTFITQEFFVQDVIDVYEAYMKNIRSPAGAGPGSAAEGDDGSAALASIAAAQSHANANPLIQQHYSPLVGLYPLVMKALKVYDDRDKNKKDSESEAGNSAAAVACSSSEHQPQQKVMTIVLPSSLPPVLTTTATSDAAENNVATTRTKTSSFRSSKSSSARSDRNNNITIATFPPAEVHHYSTLVAHSNSSAGASSSSSGGGGSNGGSSGTTSRLHNAMCQQVLHPTVGSGSGKSKAIPTQMATNRSTTPLVVWVWERGDYLAQIGLRCNMMTTEKEQPDSDVDVNFNDSQHHRYGGSSIGNLIIGEGTKHISPPGGGWRAISYRQSIPVTIELSPSVVTCSASSSSLPVSFTACAHYRGYSGSSSSSSISDSRISDTAATVPPITNDACGVVSATTVRKRFLYRSDSTVEIPTMSLASSSSESSQHGGNQITHSTHANTISMPSRQKVSTSSQTKAFVRQLLCALTSVIHTNHARDIHNWRHYDRMLSGHCHSTGGNMNANAAMLMNATAMNNINNSNTNNTSTNTNTNASSTTLEHQLGSNGHNYTQSSCNKEAAVDISHISSVVNSSSAPAAYHHFGGGGSGHGLSINTETTENNCQYHKLVHCSSTIDGVGVFTAYTNGTIRCVFDDRTIVSLSTIDHSNHRHHHTETNTSSAATTQTHKMYTTADMLADHDHFNSLVITMLDRQARTTTARVAHVMNYSNAHRTTTSGGAGGGVAGAVDGGSLGAATTSVDYDRLYHLLSHYVLPFKHFAAMDGNDRENLFLEDHHANANQSNINLASGGGPLGGGNKPKTSLDTHSRQQHAHLNTTPKPALPFAASTSVNSTFMTDLVGSAQTQQQEQQRPQQRVYSASNNAQQATSTTLSTTTNGPSPPTAAAKKLNKDENASTSSGSSRALAAPRPPYMVPPGGGPSGSRYNSNRTREIELLLHTTKQSLEAAEKSSAKSRALLRDDMF